MCALSRHSFANANYLYFSQILGHFTFEHSPFVLYGKLTLSVLFSIIMGSQASLILVANLT